MAQAAQVLPFSGKEPQAVMTPSMLAEFFSFTIPAHHNVLVVGQPGIGKTDISKQGAAAAGADLIMCHPVVDSPIDYKGLPFVASDGKADFTPTGFLRAMISASKLTVVVLDDLAQAPPAVQAACMQLLLERRINEHVISPHITFVACSNRKEDKAGAMGILEPVKSRFVSIVHLVPDLDDWVLWALIEGIPPELIAFVRMFPEILTGFKPTSDMTNSPCPRTIHNVGKLMQLNLPAHLEYPAYAGAIGEAETTRLMGFLKIARKMPDPAVIIMQPDTAPVFGIDEPGVLRAICAALATQANDQNVDSIVRYSERIPADFAAVMMDDIIRKDPELQQTAGFIRWATNNHHVTL